MLLGAVDRAAPLSCLGARQEQRAVRAAHEILRRLRGRRRVATLHASERSPREPDADENENREGEESTHRRVS